MGLRIKRGDKVEVISGKDRGKRGKVLSVSPSSGRVIVEGVNLAKKHLRRRSEGDPGGIKEIPLSLQASNLALFCSRCERGVRFRIGTLEDKSKIRICQRCQQPI